MTETVRPPKQQRSRRSFERVLEASVHLLEENGVERFTIQEVSRRAGVSVGAIYARFGQKESLLRAVHQHAMDAMAEQQPLGAADPPPPDPAEAIARAVEDVTSVFRTNEKLLGTFMHLGAVDDEVSRRGSAASTALAQRFAAVVLAHRDAIAHPDPETAVDVAFRMTYCTCARRVLNGPTYESDRLIEWDALVDELAAACAGYLLHPPIRRRTNAP